MAAMELALFDEAAEVARGLIPRELGVVRCRARRYGVKVWFDTAHPPREHYEAQVIGADLVAGGRARTLAVEIGFHAEHSDADRNDRVVAALVGAEHRWRRRLGREAESGPFLGRADVWRRISETWPDPDLSEPALGFEIGSRLADYVLALEPVRRRAGAPRPDQAGRRSAGS